MKPICLPPLIAILRHISPEECIPVMTLLIEAGFKIIEVPLNSKNALTSISLMAENAEQGILIGAGTVVSSQQVDDVFNAGGRVIISPNCDQQIIRKSKQLDMISIPGCLTPTEIFNALNAGADAIKLFPTEQVSVSTMKAMATVLPVNTNCFMVGGINNSNMQPYLAAGASGFGIGSSLYKPGKSLKDIKRDATQIMQAFQQASSHINLKHRSI